ncbi:hypothetical protein ACE1SV_22560 [Streptomyces sennicomposti]
MGDEEDTSCHADAGRGAAADGALTLHATQDAAIRSPGSETTSRTMRRTPHRLTPHRLTPALEEYRNGNQR